VAALFRGRSPDPASLPCPTCQSKLCLGKLCLGKLCLGKLCLGKQCQGF